MAFAFQTWHIATRGRWQHSGELMGTNLPGDFKSWLSASHLSPAKPCFLWCQQPQRWSRFAQEELGRRVLSFSDLVEELKTEVSENPIPTGKVQKRRGTFHVCSISVDIFQKYYMTGSLPTGAQAHKDTDNGQRKVVLSFPALAG